VSDGSDLRTEASAFASRLGLSLAEMAAIGPENLHRRLRLAGFIEEMSERDAMIERARLAIEEIWRDGATSAALTAEVAIAAALDVPRTPSDGNISAAGHPRYNDED
jgi:hypothetical protein